MSDNESKRRLEEYNSLCDRYDKLDAQNEALRGLLEEWLDPNGPPTQGIEEYEDLVGRTRQALK